MMDLIQSVQLPVELQTRAAHCAAVDGVSLEHWVIEAVANKAKTAEFFQSRIQRAGTLTLQEILDKAPNRPPDPGDELEA